MQAWHHKARLLFACLALVAGLSASSFSYGGEACSAFVAGLRSLGYYDTALDYLESMRTSPVADEAFRETIDYEAGITLLEGSRQLPLDSREPELEKGREFLRKFLFEHPQHALGLSANRHLANLLVERGMIKKALSGKEKPGSETQNQLLIDARSFFTAAQKDLIAIDKQLSQKNKSYQSHDLDDEAKAVRDKLRDDIVMTRLTISDMDHEIAETYPPGSKERKEGLVRAAQQYSDYYNKYQPRLGAYRFRFKEVQCYVELKEYDKAFRILKDLTIPRSYDEATMRGIRTMAVWKLLEIYLSPDFKQYKEAWAAYENWEQNIERPEEADDRATAVKYLGGEAALELARGIDEANEAQASAREDYLKRAKKLFERVARHPGDYQMKALLKLSDPLLNAGEKVVKQPKDFAEASGRALLAWEEMQKPDLTRSQAAQLQAEAAACFRFALAHPPAGVNKKDLVVFRYCLAYLNYVAEKYYDAAVLGEFIARRYPDNPQAKSAAQIGLKSYARLISEAERGEDTSYESGRMAALALYITERWPRTELSNEAWTLLIQTAIAKRDIRQAVDYLNRIPADSAERGNAELLTGLRLAYLYFNALQLPKDKRPLQGEMNLWSTEARKALEAGIARSRKQVEAGGTVSYLLANGSLKLTHFYIDAGETEKAIALLEDPKIGAYTLACSGDKAYDQPGFRIEAFMAALRAYAARQQFDKAGKVMDEMERIGGSVNLSQTYIDLGRQLEESLKRFRSEEKKDEAARVAEGFDFFLTRIANRPAKEMNARTLLWAASAFESLAASAGTGEGDRPTPKAVEDYEKAVKVYAKIAEEAKADKEYATDGELQACQIGQVGCLRRLGKCEAAIELLVPMLKANENRLDIQQAAARVYQDWGKDVPEKYLSAIRGDYPIERADHSPDYMIWGWGGIARRVESVEKFQAAYFDARYNLAECRLKYALTKEGEEKDKLIREAQDDIVNIQRLRPEMGGEASYAKYDALLRQIQGLLGIPEKQQGLKVSEERFSSPAE